MRIENLGKDILRLVKYSLSTLPGTGVDMLVLWLFSHYVLNGYWGEYILSPIISFECAVLVNFTLAYFFVWRDRVTAFSAKSFFKHYLGYNLASTGTFLIKMCFLMLFERFFGWDVLICNLLALCFAGFMNFLLNERVVFGNGKLSRKHRFKNKPGDEGAPQGTFDPEVAEMEQEVKNLPAVPLEGISDGTEVAREVNIPVE